MRLSAAFFAAIALLAQTRPGDIEFVKIAPGEFTMGCSTGDTNCGDDEKPAHRVQITKAFEIGKYEVTQAQWQAVMGSNPSTIRGDNRPVETISRDDARDFLARLNARNDGYQYRLPTEAEWEYAARAGNSAAVSLEEVAWFAGNSEDETHPVGQKKPNAWGIYDMLGNVREWVDDLYTRDSYGTPSGGDTAGAPGQRGGRGGGRSGGGRGGRGGRQLPVIRGGAWDNTASFVRVSARYHYYGPTLKVSDIGFRAAREPRQ
ncbi:MAG TPA: formylglycine-generating enzyme family protein [Bryobacteraceae bacterium]